jgi:hypothetical protein
VGGWWRSARNRRFRVGEKIIVYRTVAGFARQAPMGLAAGSAGRCVSVIRSHGQCPRAPAWVDYYGAPAEAMTGTRSRVIPK